MENVVDYSKIVELMLKSSKMVAEDAENSYIPQAIEKIYKWYVQCDQENCPTEGYKEVLRVVRVRRGLPKYFFYSHQSADPENASEYSRVVLGGMYMVVRCAIISPMMLSSMRSQSHSRSSFYELPEEMREIYAESTLRFNGDGSAVVLKKSDLTDWIYYGSHYQLLELI